MRRVVLAVGALLSLAPVAQAAPYGYVEAQRGFDAMPVDLRQLAQVLLLSAGYGNAVVTQQFSTRTFAAIESFQADSGFAADGIMTKAEIDKLIETASIKLGEWQLRRVTLPGRNASLWVPFGLDLETRMTDKGFSYKDKQNRFGLRFVALPNVPGIDAFNDLVAKKAAAGDTIHFKQIKDDWFVVSSTSADGADHYARYHQVGDDLIGFAMDWNNAAGTINAERIATLDSGVLAASVHGEPMIDPPEPASPAPAARPAPQDEAKREVTPAPEPPKKEGFSTGSGFFVSDEGHFVTNAHVVRECATVMVKTDDGKTREAARTATDNANDLAILKLDMGRDAAGKDIIPKRVAPLRIGARLGEGVEAFGFPHADMLSSGGNFTLGNVTALAGLGDDTRYLQVSAPVQRGNSGGPLLDGAGNLLGVVTLKMSHFASTGQSDEAPQNINFAVKSATLAQFLDANRVAYKTGVAGKPLEPADIADQARAMSGFVVCR